MKFNMVKTEDGRNIPATDKDKEKLAKVGIGEVYRCETISQRNYKLLQKYWVLMDFGFENAPEKYNGAWATVEDFEDEVLKAIGWRTASKNFKGETVYKSKSISYDSVPDDNVFQEIYERCVDFMARFLGIDRPDLVNEVIEQFG